jgi:hypothetical protein
MTSKRPAHVYEVRSRKDKRGVDLISDAMLFGLLWYYVLYSSNFVRNADAISSLFVER